MLVRTLTKSAGRFNFEAGREIDLDLSPAELKELVKAGAVQKVEQKVKPDEPKTDSQPGQSAG